MTCSSFGDSIHPRPLINPHKRFALITNAKCGGTTMKAWFAISLDLPRTMSSSLSVIRHYGIRFFRRWRRNERELRSYRQAGFLHSDDVLRQFIDAYREVYVASHIDYLSDSRFLRFAVVRDPYARIVSAFLDKFCGEDVGQPWVSSVMDAAGVSPGDFCFNHFLDYLLGADPASMNAHWRPQSFLLDQIDLDQFVCLESLSRDICPIETRLSLQIFRELPFKRQKTNHLRGGIFDPDETFVDYSHCALIRMKCQNGGHPPKDQFLNRSSVLRKIETIYRRDFEILPYAIRE